MWAGSGHTLLLFNNGVWYDILALWWVGKTTTINNYIYTFHPSGCGWVVLGVAFWFHLDLLNWQFSKFSIFLHFLFYLWNYRTSFFFTFIRLNWANIRIPTQWIHDVNQVKYTAFVNHNLFKRLFWFWFFYIWTGKSNKSNDILDQCVYIIYRAFETNFHLQWLGCVLSAHAIW